MKPPAPTVEPQPGAAKANPSPIIRIMQSKVVRLTGTAVCLWIIASSVDLGHILHIIRSARIELVLSGWLVTCCVMLFAFAEWGVIVSDIKKIRFVELFIIFLRMLAPSVVLPAGIGGEAVRILQISRHIGPANAAAAAVLARMSSAFAMAILAFVGATQVSANWSALAVGCSVLYLVCTGAVWSVVFYPRSLVDKFVGWLSKLNRKFISATMVPFVVSLHEIGARRRAVVLALAASLCGWATNFAALQLFSQAVGATVPWYYFAVALPISLVSTFAPFVLGGIGVREGILMTILVQSGISAEQAGVIAILVDVQMLPFIALSALSWLLPQDFDKRQSV